MLPFYYCQTVAHLVEYVEGVIFIVFCYSIQIIFDFRYADVFMVGVLVIDDDDVLFIQLFIFYLLGYKWRLGD